MKILSAAQMKEADIRTLEQQGVSSWELMERASQAVFRQLATDLPDLYRTFCILCGAGNNGGDGLAIARMLHGAGANVHVLLWEHDRYSPDNHTNQLRLQNMGIAVTKFDLSSLLDFPREAIVLDCLFGYGLSRPLDDSWKSIVAQVNKHPWPVLSVDLPSGLLPDRPTPAHHPVVRAHTTYTFACPKLALLLPENAPYTGHFKILDIGLDKDFMEDVATDFHYLEKSEIAQRIPVPQKYAHKGTYGHALIAGGSHGKIGAVTLSSKAALRTGCGLVTAYAPQCGYTILQSSFPEAMVLSDPDEHTLSVFPEDLTAYDAVGAGVGMGTHPKSQRALSELLHKMSETNKAACLVLDADALNILSLQPEWLYHVPKHSILTPHPKELERLIGPWGNDLDKLQKTQEFSAKYRVVTLIKGAHTAIVCPSGQIYFNATGNPGMATAGSGDVLTGVITSLLAQGLQPIDAAVVGVFLHGLAGDIAVQGIHPKSLIASDIIAHLPKAWQSIDKEDPHI